MNNKTLLYARIQVMAQIDKNGKINKNIEMRIFEELYRPSDNIHWPNMHFAPSRVKPLIHMEIEGDFDADKIKNNKEYMWKIMERMGVAREYNVTKTMLVDKMLQFKKTKKSISFVIMAFAGLKVREISFSEDPIQDHTAFDVTFCKTHKSLCPNTIELSNEEEYEAFMSKLKDAVHLRLELERDSVI